jgi:hypothetical protein
LVCWAEATPSNGNREATDRFGEPSAQLRAMPIANATAPLPINRFEGSLIYISPLISLMNAWAWSGERWQFKRH